MSQAEAFLGQLSTDGLPVVCYVVDETDVRPRIVGGAPADVFGTDISANDALVRYVHRDDRSRVLAARLTTLHDRRSARIEYRIQPPESDPRWVLELMKVSKARDQAKLVGVVVDVTADHQAFDWVDASLHEAEELVAKLQHRDEARTTFLNLLLHDVRPALNACQQGLETLCGGEISPPSIHSLQASLAGMAELLEELLDVERFRDPAALQVERVDLAEVARDVIGQVTRPHVSGQLQPAKTRGDALLLKRIIHNLIRNAVIHTAADTTISVRTWSDAVGACLEVVDDGPGIPAEHTEEIFEPYYRLNGHERPGLGMGLALVRRVIELHGGTCRVMETPGGGATFRIELAAAAGEAVPIERSDARSSNGRVRPAPQANVG